MTAHDPLCTHNSTPYVCDCNFINRVRADEREQAWRDGDDRLWAATAHGAEVRDRLRAQVEAIQPYTHTNDRTDVVRRADVLALLDGTP